MSKNNLKKLIRDYLNTAVMMQIATSKSNQPWACTVYFTHDEYFNLYWLSLPSRRHSEEIRTNEKVAGTIVLPHTLGDDVRGLQFQGIARELATKEEAILGMQYYAKRYGMSQDRVTSIVENKDGHLCYKITPSLFVLFDELNFPDNSRQEYKII